MAQSARPLIITEDAELLDDLLRLCAAAGAEPEVAHDGRRPPGLGARAAGPRRRRRARRSSGPRRRAVPMCSSSGTIPTTPTSGAGLELGADHVVFLPDAEAWLVDRIADADGGRCPRGADRRRHRRPRRRRRQHPGLRPGVHRDASRPSHPCSSTPIRWAAASTCCSAARTRRGCAGPPSPNREAGSTATALDDSLPRLDALRVLSWDRGDVLTIPPAAMRAVLAAARRGRELVVVDLPRRLDEAATEALAGRTSGLLVVPAELRAAAAAGRVASDAGPGRPGSARRRSGARPRPDCPLRSSPLLGLPLAGEMPAEPRHRDALERGEPPAGAARGPLARFCGRILRQLRAACRGRGGVTR